VSAFIASPADEKAEFALDALGLVPGPVGLIASAASAGVSIYQGDYHEAALKAGFAVGALVGVGLAVKFGPSVLKWGKAGLGSVFKGVGKGAAARGAANVADDVASGGAKAFHHTVDAAVESISRTGLRPGSYATPTGGLSPLQAHIELALNPAGGARNAILQIDLAGLRGAGYQIPSATRVSGQFGMPGGPSVPTIVRQAPPVRLMKKPSRARMT